MFYCHCLVSPLGIGLKQATGALSKQTFVISLNENIISIGLFDQELMQRPGIEGKIPLIMDMDLNENTSKEIVNHCFGKSNNNKKVLTHLSIIFIFFLFFCYTSHNLNINNTKQYIQLTILYTIFIFFFIYFTLHVALRKCYIKI